MFISLFEKFTARHNLLIIRKVPVIGGLGVGLSFIVSCIIGFSLSQPPNLTIIGIICASLLMLIFGIIDDCLELSVVIKFMVQIIATSLLVLFGVKTQIMNITDTFNVIITFIWVLGITNAFNHLDIIDGLCGGIAFIVSMSFFAICLLTRNQDMSILFLVLAASTLGFIMYNFPPAKIYLGNSGSHFLGFVLSACAIVISYATSERKVALAAPLLILGMPIYDTVFLIARRWKNKRSMFKKSFDHLAFRFLEAGYSNKKIMIILCILGLFFSLSGILVSQIPNKAGIAIILLNILVGLVIGWRMDGSQHA